MSNNTNDYEQVSFAKPSAIAIYLVISMVMFLLLGYFVWSNIFILSNISGERLALLKIVIYAFSFGGIGGTCYSMYGLYKHIAEGDYRPSYMYWYLFRGPVGAILGLISFFLIQGGILTFSGQEMIFGSSKSTFQSKAAIVCLAFLAGFATNHFVVKLRELAKTFFGSTVEKSSKTANSSEKPKVLD
ncbi:MAG: hypothetical protein KAR84_08345 [Elusimicrobiales bacterium]|nr:hypothetical protein [Elusimicrobiales bacterium]